MDPIVFLPLTQGYVAVIDFDDFEKVRPFKWHAQKTKRRVYAGRSIRLPDGRWSNQALHTFLVPDAVSVDHEDGDGLNNRRGNLRAATTQQNLRGFRRKIPGATSKFRGVSWHSRRARRHAGININGKDTSLGRFLVEEDAARAYDVAARKYFGEFASPNFP